MFHSSSVMVYYAGALYNKTSSRCNKLFSKAKYWRCHPIKSTIPTFKLAIFLFILPRTRFPSFKSYFELNHRRLSGQHSRQIIISKSLSKAALFVMFWGEATSLSQSGVSQFLCFYALILIIHSPNVVISCDTNFTQKRHKGQCDERDALLIHLDIVFLSEEKVKEMERHVLQLRPGPHGQIRKFVNKTNRGKNVDKCEERLLIPNSILDICQNSFLAADKKREKAGTQFFKDTGLMALLC